MPLLLLGLFSQPFLKKSGFLLPSSLFPGSLFPSGLLPGGFLPGGLLSGGFLPGSLLPGSLKLKKIGLIPLWLSLLLLSDGTERLVPGEGGHGLP